MTQLRNLVLGGAAAALVMSGAVTKSFAIEAGDVTNYERGASQGLPLGALPPPGLYFSFAWNATGLGSSPGVGQQVTGFASNPIIGGAPVFLWVPGWNFLGATYGASVVQPIFVGWDLTPVNPGFTAVGVSGPSFGNTSITPIDLSWNLGQGWFASLALTFVPPDGSRWTSTAVNLNLNPDYWTISPGAAISYISANWLLSANFLYQISGASAGTCCVGGAGFLPAGAAAGYTSGDELFGDLTALYKFGKWQIGPVGYFEVQTTNDRPGGGVPCTFGVGGICGHQSQVAVGGLIGYDFGPVAIQLWADDTVECHDAVCGIDVWSRISFKIWGPDAKPLVAKN
jgi:hypothetical protein